MFPLFFAVCLLGFWSCSEDDSSGDGEVTGACSDFENEWEDVMNALSAYSENPNEQNCENYKTALRGFYSEFEDCRFWGPEYQEAVDAVDEIDCSEA